MMDVDVAEAVAIRRGLELASVHGIRDLSLESDVQSVINAINHPRHDLSYLSSIVRDLVDMAASLGRVSFLCID